MTGAKQFGLGIKTYGQAVSFIFKNKMGWTFLVPIALTVLLFIGGQALINELIDYLQGNFNDWLGLDEEGFWSGFIGVIVGVIIEFVFFFLIIPYVFGFIVIILMSPLLAYLSEKTEKILTGEEFSTSFSQLLKDVLRGIFIAIRNLVIELLMMILLVIPVVGWILVFIIAFYFYGFSFIDFSNERHKLNIRQSVALMRKYKWLAIGNGLMYYLFLVIPFCSFFLPMFGSIVAVVAATLAMHKTGAYKKEEVVDL